MNTHDRGCHSIWTKQDFEDMNFAFDSIVLIVGPSQHVMQNN